MYTQINSVCTRVVIKHITAKYFLKFKEKKNLILIISNFNTNFGQKTFGSGEQLTNEKKKMNVMNVRRRLFDRKEEVSMCQEDIFGLRQVIKG